MVGHHSPKYNKKAPDTRMPIHASVMLNLVRTPKGTTWKTLDWMNCRARVPTRASPTPPSSSRGSDWMTYLKRKAL